MEDKVYVGDGLKVIMTSNVDISSAINMTAEVRVPPSGEIITVPVTRTDVFVLEFSLTAAQLSKPGTYKYQPIITLGAWTGRGSTDEFLVFKKFE